MSYKLVLHAGPDLTDASRRLIHLWGPLTHCCEKKKESVNQFAKIGKLCSESTVIKKFSIISEVPTITAFVAAFDAKALNCTELLESYLADGNRIINCHRQTNRNRHNWNIWYNTWLFIRITSVFSYLYCKRTYTLHLYSMRGRIKTLKHNVRTTLQLSYHGCKYLTYTSKTPHVIRTQMVVTVRFTIRVTSLPRWNKQGIKVCDSFLAYYTCGVKLLEYRYAQVWNIAKRRKQSPIGWFL